MSITVPIVLSNLGVAFLSFLATLGADLFSTCSSEINISHVAVLVLPVFPLSMFANEIDCFLNHARSGQRYCTVPTFGGAATFRLLVVIVCGVCSLQCAFAVLKSSAEFEVQCRVGAGVCAALLLATCLSLIALPCWLSVPGDALRIALHEDSTHT